MKITNTRREEYRRFVEIKRDDYVYLWHNILESYEPQVMSDEQLAIAEQRFDYWNRSVEDIMKSFEERYENIEITPMLIGSKSDFDELFTAREDELIDAVSV